MCSDYLFLGCFIMTGTGDIPSGSGKHDIPIEFDDPLYIHQSDNYVTKIITIN